MNRIQSSMAALLITTASVAAPSIQAGESHAMPAASWADIHARGHLLFQHDRALAAAQRRAQASRTFTHDDRVVTAVSEKIDESLLHLPAGYGFSHGGEAATRICFQTTKAVVESV